MINDYQSSGMNKFGRVDLVWYIRSGKFGLIACEILFIE